MNHHVFIGYDPREHVAAKVCASSIRRRGGVPHFLNDRELRKAKLYNRPYHVTEDGQYVDDRDGRPFSTMFAFTRFLTLAAAAEMCLHEQFYVFCDCDFIFQAPVAELFAQADPTKAIQVVKHNHHVAAENAKKMDGISQGDYQCKNWSSLILWNAGHPANAAVLKSDLANHYGGRALHRFGWIEDRELIGELHEEWNWLAGISPTTNAARATRPKAIHFTEGTPEMDGYVEAPYADLYRDEKALGGLIRA